MKWWIAADGKPDGPYGTEYVQTLLASGAVASGQLACPVGSSTWSPLTSHAVFQTPRDQDAATQPPPLPPEPVSHLAFWDWMFVAAGWYRFAIVPGLFAVSVGLGSFLESDYIEGSPPDQQQTVFGIAALLLNVLLVFLGSLAGHGLLERRREAVLHATLITVAQWVVSAGVLVVSSLIGMAADPASLRIGPGQSLADLDLLILFVLVGVALLSFLFEVLSLVAIWRGRDRLCDSI